MRAYAQTSGNLPNRMSTWRDLMRCIMLEIVAVAACPISFSSPHNHRPSVYQPKGRHFLVLEPPEVLERFTDVKRGDFRITLRRILREVPQLLLCFSRYRSCRVVRHRGRSAPQSLRTMKCLVRLQRDRVPAPLQVLRSCAER